MNSQGYGGPSSGQRLPAQQNYEAPACVQNAMMTKDKKPFTYTPGGIDLSQIKSERMAKRLARNAQAEGTTGAAQQNRPPQPQSPGGGSSVAASMGAAAMGMPFQVLPPPPPPAPPSSGVSGKKTNGATPIPPPPPPTSSSLNPTNTLAPPANGSGGVSSPGSPNTARKSPTPQRFEPPPMGFRPEIKIPTNPMAALRKVPPPVEKNTFWKDEYVKERSKSPMVGGDDTDNNRNSPNNVVSYNEINYNNNNSNINNNNNNNYDDGFKKSTPATTTNIQKPEANYNYNNNNGNNNTNIYNQQYSPQQTQQTSPQYMQQTEFKTPTTPPPQQQQQQQSARLEFRSVAAPQSPAVHVYTRQTDSPRSDGTPPLRTTDSPFKFAQQQQQHQQQQQRTIPAAISPLAQPQQYQQHQQHQQHQTPSTIISQPSAQTVPWRTQRNQEPSQGQQPQQQKQQQQQQQQQHPQPIYNNVQQQQFQPQQQQQGEQSKPTNVGSLYIAPLAPSAEPQAQHIVRQQLQQQQQQRDSPMRQLPQQQSTQLRQPARWMSTQPMPKEQPEWVRSEENGNVVPSSLQRIKSPPPPPLSHQQQQQMPQQQPGQQQYQYQPIQGNGFAPQNFGAQTNASPGLRLQINTTSPSNQSGPRERIIPIQLEQTPTNTPGQPNFNAQPFVTGSGNMGTPVGYVIRSPNQFVDQGYNNYPVGSTQQQQQQQQLQQSQQQLNAPRNIQQQQQQLNNSNAGGVVTRIVPIAVESEGTRGPIMQSPVVLQNDSRTTPVQSKSFRILQKITDTADDENLDGGSTTNSNSKNDNFIDVEPQLQRPQFARQMSAQQARNSPTIDQMRRMQISQGQQQQQQQSPQAWNQGSPTAQSNKFVQQSPNYNNNDMPQQYVHPSEQSVPEPKKYTGSAIPSRSFKILQAMTTPENAGPGQSDL